MHIFGGIYRVATLLGDVEFDNLGKKKPGKTWIFGNYKKNLKKPGILNKNI